jgi:hypothetical protein
MQTHYFTIVSGSHYEMHLQRLLASAARLGISIEVIRPSATTSVAAIKKTKPELLRDYSLDCDRLTYVDADTVLVDLAGIELLSGSLREPWGMGKVPLTPLMDTDQETLNRQSQLFDLLAQRGLADFLPGGKFHRQEWNSGVITGQRSDLKQLGAKWLEWWQILDVLFDGRFRRDQIAYRYAYFEWSRDYVDRFEEPFNWICKRRGLCPTPKIYHFAGLQKQPKIQARFHRAICQQRGWT